MSENIFAIPGVTFLPNFLMLYFHVFQLISLADMKKIPVKKDLFQICAAVSQLQTIFHALSSWICSHDPYSFLAGCRNAYSRFYFGGTGLVKLCFLLLILSLPLTH